MTMETTQVGNSLNTFSKGPGPRFKVEDNLVAPTSPGLLCEELNNLFEKELGGLNFGWGLSIRVAGDDIYWVDPRNTFYKGPAVFVYDNYYFSRCEQEGIKRREFPIRISDRIMNPTGLDICRFLNPIFAVDGPVTDHNFLEGISPLKLMEGTEFEQSVPVFSFHFAS